ncbi:MAG: protein translocase subunit SecDF [Lentimicrobiaceae bacterium]|jgi:SecD/SecF fusion protein|nr:protein translocase subunit SecDF [Lentimicrobiaceae bacterium]
MQNKGVIKVFAIALAIVSLYQLSFTFVGSNVEKKAKKYATNEQAVNLAKEQANGNELKEVYIFDSIQRVRENRYLDSMENQVVYNILIDKYTYREVKERTLNLGLDLKGGMNVVIEVSVKDIIIALSQNSKDPVFTQAIEMASQRQKNSQSDYLTLFGQAFDEIDPNARLASIFIYEFKDDGIDVNSTNIQVLDVLRTECEGAIDRSFQILRTRIDRFGVTQPNIQKLATSGRILVELPGIKDPKRVRKLLQGTAQLEFWETYNFNEEGVLQAFIDANDKIAEANKAAKLEKEKNTVVEEAPVTEEIITEEVITEEVITEETTTEEGEKESSLIDQITETDLSASKEDDVVSLFTYLMPSVDQNGQPIPSARVGTAAVKDTATINSMLKRVYASPFSSKNLKLAWTVKPRIVENQEYVDLIALKASRDGGAVLGGDVIDDARQDYNYTGQVEVMIQMNSVGAKNWKRVTADNIGRQVAVVLDGYVYSYPVVNDEIPNGRSSISGGEMNIEEAKDLANILKTGKLPAPSRIVEENVVGPSLGQEAVNSGMWSFVLAFMLVIVYMVFFYNKAGIVASISLIVNVFFMFGVLASFGAVLTLPGIAGIVLTLGMAVDANVIIYERIKEEVRAGKGLGLAITDGYKNAYSAIIDGQVTTLLTAIVLYVFGTGPVQGFATTLIIGILTSLFTAIFISRLIFDFMLSKNRKITFSRNITRNFMSNVKFDFIKNGKKAYIISGIVILLGVGSLVLRGLNYGIDFTGGRTYLVRFDQDVAISEVRKNLAEYFTDATPEVKTFGPNRQVKITTKYLIEDDGPAVDSTIQTMLYQSLENLYQDKLSYNEFTADDESGNKMIGILSSQKVGPSIAVDIRNKAILAVVLSLVIMFIYILIRFKKWQYGMSSVIALAHDALVVIGVFSLFYSILPFSMEVDQSFIAAILTVIGYSINSTVVIFDRIRENTVTHPKRSMLNNINDGVNSTLVRTINTSITTLVVLLAIFLFGGEVIRGFVFALLVGILAGIFSSLFIASPLAYDTMKGGKKEEGVDKSKKK